jgi:hypothetical protein
MWFQHGSESKPHDELSSGQRIATFVKIMLLDLRGPFIVDTPEHDVSSKYLAEHICPALAEAQVQYIIVTHAGNVPVLGRARRVIELYSADGTGGAVKKAGAPREALEPMADHLEGGREAFVKRKDFYGV